LDENNPGIAFIPLNQGKSVRIDIIDIDLAEFRWTLNCGRYANRRIEKNGQGKHVSMHRVVLERRLGRPITSGMVVDHINGDGLDNRRENLREATQAQNLRNTRLRSDNTSRYKGVTCTGPNTWKAFINEQLIGYFDTAEEAAFAYDKAALEMYGESARLNHSIEQVLAWVPPVRLLRKTNSSGYRGVKKSRKRWSADIHTGGQYLHLGMFDVPEEAAKAYDKAALEIFGARAILNFPVQRPDRIPEKI